MKDALIKILGEKNLLVNEPIKNFTTFKIGGNADFIALPENIGQAVQVIKYLRNEKIKYVILGNGSNVLAHDEGYRGVVVCLSGLKGLECEGTTLKIEAGVLLSKASKFALENSLSGMEEISGIPGSLGGAIYMNAGAYGKEIREVLESVTYLDEAGEIVTKNASEIKMLYRDTFFMESDTVVLSAILKLKKGDYEAIKESMREVTHKRVSKQPLEFPSAGSTFKRPEGHFAGKLIEDSGLKGYTIGGAQVSKKHAGFVINIGNATYSDVIALTEYIKKTVKENYQVELELEVELL